MSVTAPVHARIMPIGPSTDDPDNFDPEADAWVADVRPFGIELNSLSDNVFDNATDAAASATAAAGSATAASGSATAAGGSATAASGSATAAAGSATAAAGSAAAAATSATSLTANSTTSFAVGNGAKAFTVPAGKQFPNGAVMAVTSVGTPTLRMFGPVASYVGTTLTLTITKFEGSGTAADWVIGPAGAEGAAGGTAGGQLTSALDEKEGTDLASASTIDPWSTGGNTMALTGSLVVNGIAPAPQAGAKRTLNVKGSPTFTSGANVVVKGGTTVLTAGDAIDIEAETTTLFNVTIRRGDGTATAITLFRNAAFFDSSATWIAPRDGLVRFHSKGADGSGGVAMGNGAVGRCVAASGGGAGGYAVRTVYVKAGDSFALSPGARAAVPTNGTTTGAFPGSDGGATTVSGPGVSITCNGGTGGHATSATSTAVAASAPGGTATGGDINYTGGASGAATATSTTGAPSAATGGGAFGYRGNAPKSGDATATDTGNGAISAATGGAGVGGNSGNATATGNGTTTSSPTAGAGSVGASANNTAGTTTMAGGLGMPASATQTPLTLNGVGSTGLAAAQPTPPSAPLAGAGSGALIATNLSSGLAGPAAAMAASGALTVRGSTGAAVSSGICDYGGGSGGLAGQTTGTAQTLTSGLPGKAFVLVEYN